MPNNYTSEYKHVGQYPVAQTVNADGSWVHQRNAKGKKCFVNRWRKVLVDTSKYPNRGN